MAAAGRGRRRVSGHYAGPVTRLAATALDSGLVSGTFAAGSAVAVYGIRLVTGLDLSGNRVAGWVWLVLFVGWAFTYTYAGLALAGRTPGKAVVGLRVVSRDGTPLSSSRAFVRTVAFPLSFAFFGAGLLGILVGRERRALHDVLAGSVVVYDWGDRPVELPTPISRFLDERDALPTLEPRSEDPDLTRSG